MKEINNYKLQDFLKQDKSIVEQYMLVLRYLNPVKTKEEVFFMSLEDVEFIKENIYSESDISIIEIISRVEGVSVSDVYKMRIIRFFGLVASVRKQLNTIQEAESRSLASDNISVKWELVKGSERVSKFRILNTLRTLNNGNFLNNKEIMKRQYSEVFMQLLMNKEYNDIAREMDSIKTTAVN